MLNNLTNTMFLESNKGILLQILLVLIPPVFFLKSSFLLLGLFLSTLLAWGMLRLRNKRWKDVGLHKPENIGRLLLITLIATAILFPMSYMVKQAVIKLTGAMPNLENFTAIHGNIAALAVGLLVAWFFGAFLEEFLFRGYLQNTLHAFCSKVICPQWIALTIAILATSVCTGIGHFYQGITGMLTAGFIAIGFSVIYLLNRRNLWASILAHGLYDTVAFLFVYGGIITT
ncbi:MAG: CPBP family intramembrane metalloprotease [Desulfovibrionaceae bacterium]|nr:CPBP family intramembrane metalloprotease [Desulfovibrionaceae bacterium]